MEFGGRLEKETRKKRRPEGRPLPTGTRRLLNRARDFANDGIAYKI
jgi:hypothetical protein